jgi:hypothetical protein
LPYIERMHEHHHRDVRALVGKPTWLSIILFLIFVFFPVMWLAGFATASLAT